MPRQQVTPLPRQPEEIDRSRLAPDDKHDLNEIVKMVSRRFSQAMDEIMAAQERRRRPRH